MLSFALTALSVSLTSGVAASLLISGSTASDSTRPFGSSSVTNPLAGIADCVLKRLAHWTLLSLSAATVSGPATSSGWNFLNSAP